ncbi:hypothetical protein LENED_012009 [Lentinula edodes]|uniref:DUF4218 domain-containing protein n=1 Tax=Lentinula edodes TaxID=5353 RepID=A0A1Q3ERL2_LENED|nr:hypothetical protein LENED_012009 [Lentinula edodes]
MPNVTNIGNLSDSSNPELLAAHQAFRQGQTKAYFKRLSSETIQTLAKEYGVQAFTPTGAPSKSKMLLIDALFKWKTGNNAGTNTVKPASNAQSVLSETTASSHIPSTPINFDPHAQDQSQAALSSASYPADVRSHTLDADRSAPGHDDYLKLFFSATKSQINRYPSKVLEGIAHAVKVWKETATRAHRNRPSKGHPPQDDNAPQDDNTLPQDETDTFFETGSNGSLDYDSYELDGYDMSDYQRGFDKDEASELVVPSDNQGKRNLIHDSRFELGVTNEDGQLLNKLASTSQKSGVLGKNTLAAIREDMGKLETPSWMAAAPSRPGEASQGKFTADQWRSFCTVNLPITLIHLWGSSPHEERRYEMLVNFMHLVSAVRLADMRVMTDARIQSFEDHYRRYLTGIIGEGLRDCLGGLYPHTHVTPYQHMMFHFGDLLRRFGPVHSWRCFAFERYNYILQTTNTNKRFGEMEKTMFIRFCMMQRLKSLFHKEGFPPKVHSLVTLYQKSFENIDTRGTRVNDALAFEESSDPDPVEDWPSSSLTRLDADTYHRVLQYSTSGKLSTSVRIHNRFKRRGLTFTPDSRSFPDAQVIFSIESAEEWCAGSIKRIFTAIWRSDGKPIGKTFAEIFPYKSLVASHAKNDQYRSFGFAGGRLFYDTLEDEPLVLPLERISSHFGHSLLEGFIDVPTIHALPLNKEVDFNI